MLLRGGTRRIIASAFFGAMTNAWVGPLNTNSKVLSSYSRRVRELQQAKDALKRADADDEAKRDARKKKRERVLTNRQKSSRKREQEKTHAAKMLASK